MVLKKRDNAVHGPDWGKGRDKKEPIEVKAEGREAGAGSVEVRGRLRGEQAEPTLRGDARLAETPVIP